MNTTTIDFSAIMPKSRRVMEYFCEISAVPRASASTEGIRAYLKETAARLGLPYYADEGGNVLIKSQGTPGCKTEAPVILQGHMDMVAIADEGVCHDFETMPLELVLEDNVLRAKGTTLGADNGIAMAYMLALLELSKGGDKADDVQLPPLECLFTNDEEIGLLGASSLDIPELLGKRLINLDSEEEGIITTGCAGAVEVKTDFAFDRVEKSGILATVNISGLTGGHSGMEIIKERANANSLLARLLQPLVEEELALIAELSGGMRSNAIPISAAAALLFKDKAALDRGTAILEEMVPVIKNEVAPTDPNIVIALSAKDREETLSVIPSDKCVNIITFIRMSPHGVISRLPSIPEMVETSINTAIVTTNDSSVSIEQFLRSAVASKKADVADRITFMGNVLGGQTTLSNDYPAWQYSPKSPLRDKFVSVYEEMYKKKPIITVVHAGLECGYLSDKIEGLDCVSIGPDIFDVHTTREHISIHSVERVWEYLLRVLYGLALES